MRDGRIHGSRIMVPAVVRKLSTNDRCIYALLTFCVYCLPDFLDGDEELKSYRKSQSFALLSSSSWLCFFFKTRDPIFCSGVERRIKKAKRTCAHLRIHH